MNRTEPTSSRARALRRAIRQAYRVDETFHVRRLIRQSRPLSRTERGAGRRAAGMIDALRQTKAARGSIEAFIQEYDLSTGEGIAVLSLAEALLRIPDTATIEALIEDKLQAANWSRHQGQSDSLLVNAATLGLMLTGRLLHVGKEASSLQAMVKNLLARGGEPLIRNSMLRAVQLAGQHFVCGETLDEARRQAEPLRAKGYRYSYDMLGEAALTAEDAARYFDAYAQAIDSLGQEAQSTNPAENPGISVKLSALHPRFDYSQRERLIDELGERLLKLAVKAKTANLGLTVDAEEAEVLELTLDLFTRVYRDPALHGWDGFGLAVQAYQKRAPFVIDYLADLAETHGRRIPLRLVKGAYWDNEIKRAQQLALDGYPVLTRKAHTDISYLACTRRLFKYHAALYPQFGTHNAYTLATILELAPQQASFECQRLHGMGEALYTPLVEDGLRCRVYAPVGSHRHLLPYLVRRLLENGANASFVNRIHNKKIAVSDLTTSPVVIARRQHYRPAAHIPLPLQLHDYRSGAGMDLSDPASVLRLQHNLEKLARHNAGPLLGDSSETNQTSAPRSVFNPADLKEVVGEVRFASRRQVEQATSIASRHARRWDDTPLARRADCLDALAERLHEQRHQLIALLIREAGKTLPAAIGELREAIDYCYYYAAQARQTLAPRTLTGPTGEANTLHFYGLGVVACISPWNFPLAIFTGQIVAALVAGNCVIAKPAEQTPLIAARIVELAHKAGIPRAVLQLLPGGTDIGAALIGQPAVAGVLFTGSLATAHHISRKLAARAGLPVPLITETGGINAMVVDSTALPEQVVGDILRSAFDSAGQRCSALRLLYVQEDITEQLLTMLAGAMRELRIGDPARLATDIGPIIDTKARARLQSHLRKLNKTARLIARAPLPEDAKAGCFFAPCAYELKDAAALKQEVFGPILHVVRYAAADFDAVLDQVNATGYGLTFGLHSRIEARAEQVRQRVRAGNIYINRDMIGALVGVQPFGGRGLSGTGPKAGGPNLLLRLVTEQTSSVNSAALGGNASLLAAPDQDA